MKRVAVVNGPNLNLLGKREPEHYGRVSLEQIDAALVKRFAGRCELEFFQANGEGELVDHIQSLEGRVDGILINAAAYTHTSVAIRDALTAVGLPFVEVHLSNIHARESFRHRSFLADKALAVVCGFGAVGYELALDGLLAHLAQ